MFVARRCFGAVCALLFLSGCPGNLDPIAHFSQTASSSLAFTADDVHGRPVAVGMPSESPIILFFNGKATSDAMQPITADIAITFYGAEALTFVNVVDLRTLSFYERPFAPGAIRDAGQRTIGRINRRLRNEGLAELEHLNEHLFLIADEDGQITQRYGVPNPDQEITAIVYRRDGREIGRYDLQEQYDEVIAAISESLAVEVDDSDG